MDGLNDIKVMISDFRSLQKAVRKELPKQLANRMLEETQENFRKQAYMNDGQNEKWVDRKHEEYLNYPKLQYKGRLLKSWKTYSNPTMAGIGTHITYAQVQNEGGRTDGSWMVRRPPYSSRRIKSHILRVPARQYAGVGKRSYKLYETVIHRVIRTALR